MFKTEQGLAAMRARSWLSWWQHGRGSAFSGGSVSGDGSASGSKVPVVVVGGGRLPLKQTFPFPATGSPPLLWLDFTLHYSHGLPASCKVSSYVSLMFH